MGTVAQHRAGIKANLETVFTSSNVRDFEEKGVPSGSTWVVGWPDTFDPRATQGGDRTITYGVRFQIPWGDDETSDNALETAMQTAVAAIETDRTLGGKCDDLSCGPFVGIGAVTLGDDRRVMTFTVPVEVLD